MSGLVPGAAGSFASTALTELAASVDSDTLMHCSRLAAAVAVQETSSLGDCLWVIPVAEDLACDPVPAGEGATVRVRAPALSRGAIFGLESGWILAVVADDQTYTDWVPHPSVAAIHSLNVRTRDGVLVGVELIVDEEHDAWRRVVAIPRPVGDPVGTAWLEALLDRDGDAAGGVIPDGSFVRKCPACGGYTEAMDRCELCGQKAASSRSNSGGSLPDRCDPTSIPVRNDGLQVVERLHETMLLAEAGDRASELHMRGMGLWLRGDHEGAFAALTEAAKLGSAPAMKDAGDLMTELGRAKDARFWFETAAEVGNGPSMYNLAVFAFNANDLETAATWYQRAAEADVVDGYAALVQLADNRGDEAAEKRWARLGADAGQPFCMGRHGYYLAIEATNEQSLRRALEYVEGALDRGQTDQLIMAAQICRQLGETAKLETYVARARSTGDPDILSDLTRHNL